MFRIYSNIILCLLETPTSFCRCKKLLHLDGPSSIDADGPADGAGEPGIFDSPNYRVVHTDSEADSRSGDKRKPVPPDNKPEWERGHYKHTHSMDQLLRQ